jgi:hypothetical protein
MNNIFSKNLISLVHAAGLLVGAEPKNLDYAEIVLAIAILAAIFHNNLTNTKTRRRTKAQRNRPNSRRNKRPQRRTL